jgi:hypothetical protein
VKVQSKVRQLEIDVDGTASIYRFALSWQAFGNLQDMWKLDLADVEKKLSAPDYQTINEVLLATAVEGSGIETMDDLKKKIAPHVSPPELLAFFKEVLEAGQPTETKGQGDARSGAKKKS